MNTTTQKEMKPKARKWGETENSEMSGYHNWYSIDSDHHSECPTAKLKDLDFSNWYPDRYFYPFYLHVAHKSDDSVHRVYPKIVEAKEAGMKDGELYWII